ncbi:unnamed protein product [Pocillopora meandrina]|uniref:Uncharacterized protein n=1 Tax=Pocillopora meandrina TaxID=46732 RepID=A0AAU9VMA2_9CNID|nr:unnamed protein product [Pocillopora meandrina]
MEKLWLFSNSFMCVISVSTANAISADRLLALSLGIRYRQVVTIKRARFLVVLLLNLLPIIYERICFSRLSRHNMFFMASCLHPLLHANLSHSQKSHSGSNYSTRPPQWDIAALLLVRYKITVSSALWVLAAMIISYLPYISIFNLILPLVPFCTAGRSRILEMQSKKLWKILGFSVIVTGITLEFHLS